MRSSWRSVGAARRSLHFFVGVAATLVVCACVGSAATAPATFVRAQWHAQMTRLAVPTRGCFAGSYPNVAWHRVACHKAPKIPFAPTSAREQVGAGNDFVAQVKSGTIKTATGSFPYVSPGSTEKGQTAGTGPQRANDFSLQLNSNFATDPAACSGAADPGSCQGWQQFVYATGYGVFMQYWLIAYNTTCPAGWYSYSPPNETDCYTNSSAAGIKGAPPSIAKLKSVSLTGTASRGGNDSVKLEYNSTHVSAVGADSLVDLASTWTDAEFAILGNGSGGQANFSSGTKLYVKTAINNGATASPSCVRTGYTAETNNLSFAKAPALTAGPVPSIESQQTSAGGTAGCAVAGQKDTVTVTNPSKQTSTVGHSVKLTLHGSDNASGQTLKWSATGLPSGLTISSSTGRITGKPKRAGTSSVKVTAKDTTGAKGSASFSWVVRS